MAQKAISTKRIAISKANAQMVGVVAGAAFISIFCLVASQAIWSQNNYQSRVIKEKEVARDQLKANITSYDELLTSYQAFNSKPQNIIGGNSTGTGDRDGENAKIILDALPSAYDFPALTSSLEKILRDGNYTVGAITGTDDQANQEDVGASAKPEKVEMPFTITITDTNFVAAGQLISTLERSIRPIQVDKLQLTGGGNKVTAVITAHTFYLPSKSLTITDKVVK